MKTNADTAAALYIGLDVHKEQTIVAIADPGSDGEVRHHGSVATTRTALERVVRRIAKARKVPPGAIHVCYEAGGCGMWIARHFADIGVPCTVVATSLIPSQSGDKVKTDKKDARNVKAMSLPADSAFRLLG